MVLSLSQQDPLLGLAPRPKLRLLHVLLVVEPGGGGGGPRLDGQVDIQDDPGRADAGDSSSPSHSGTAAGTTVGWLIPWLFLVVLQVQGYRGDRHLERPSLPSRPLLAASCCKLKPSYNSAATNQPLVNHATSNTSNTANTAPSCHTIGGKERDNDTQGI